MTIIWQRKKNLLLAFVIGIIVGILPVGGYAIWKDREYNKSEESVEEIAKDMHYESKRIIMLTNSLNKGDVISKSDLTEFEILCEENEDFPEITSEIEGKCIKFSADKGTILNDNMFFEGEKDTDDIRLHLYSNFELHAGILEGSIVDIRVTFPDGEDYVVAEHKCVKSRIDNSIMIEVNEAEILKLASAAVDTEMYKGAKIYAILYAKDYQEPASSDYPVNQKVIELGSWDPNLVDKIFTEDMVNKRNILESNLNEFMMSANS